MAVLNVNLTRGTIRMAKKASKIIGLLLADHSGSMSTCKTTAQEAINGFFNERKAAATVPEIWAMVEFDTSFDEVFGFKPVADIPAYTLRPAGMTALMDAIAYSVSRLEGQSKAKSAQKILVITTDGYENSSKEHNRASVKKLLEEKQAEGWQVIYLAANQDAIKEGASFGTSPDTSMTFDVAFAAAASAGTSSMISRGASGMEYSYSAPERAAAIGYPASSGSAPTQTWVHPNMASSGAWNPDPDDEDEHYPSWL